MGDDKTMMRIRDVAREAEDGFWQTLAKATPEARTGDMPPMVATVFAKACYEAARVWYEANVPPEKPEVTTITITLEIRGSSVTAERAVEYLLDEGILQDAINEYDDDDGTVAVVSAVQS